MIYIGCGICEWRCGRSFSVCLGTVIGFTTFAVWVELCEDCPIRALMRGRRAKVAQLAPKQIVKRWADIFKTALVEIVDPHHLK